MARDDSGGSVVAAFLIGAITGAAVALLLAPATGEEMRKILAQRAREGADKASEKGRELYDRGREAYDRAKTGPGPRGGMKEPV
jgi:gas vesicle protein